MNTFFLTGGAGFVGANIVHRLVSMKKDVHVIVKHDTNLWRLSGIQNKLHIHYGNVCDTEKLSRLVKQINPHVVYHLSTRGAYENQGNASDIFRTNVEGTMSLIQSLKNTGVRLIVNTGSSSEYGIKKMPMSESDTLAPNSYYAVAKAAQTLLCQHEARAHKLPLVTFRLFSVYGPFEEKIRLMPTVLSSIYRNIPYTLASADTARDYVYVSDVVDAYLLIEHLIKHTGEIFNIGTGVQTQLKDLPLLMKEATSITVPYSFSKTAGRKWDTNTWVSNPTKAKQMLLWKAKTPLQVGLKYMWEWYKNNHHAYEV